MDVSVSVVGTCLCFTSHVPSSLTKSSSGTPWTPRFGSLGDVSGSMISMNLACDYQITLQPSLRPLRKARMPENPALASLVTLLSQSKRN